MNICTHWTADEDGVERTDMPALVRLTHEQLEAVQRLADEAKLEPDAWLGRQLRRAAEELLAFSGPGWPTVDVPEGETPKS